MRIIFLMSDIFIGIALNLEIVWGELKPLKYHLIQECSMLQHLFTSSVMCGIIKISMKVSFLFSFCNSTPDNLIVWDNIVNVIFLKITLSIIQYHCLRMSLLISCIDLYLTTLLNVFICSHSLLVEFLEFSIWTIMLPKKIKQWFAPFFSTFLLYSRVCPYGSVRNFGQYSVSTVIADIRSYSKSPTYSKTS